MRKILMLDDGSFFSSFSFCFEARAIALGSQPAKDVSMVRSIVAIELEMA